VKTNCSCTIDAFGCDNDFYQSKIVTARKEHKCVECFREIIPGQKYERVSLCNDNGWSHFNTCLPCQEIRDCFCCSFIFGEVFENIQDESYGLRLSGLESLSKPARDMFFKQINLFELEED
jgi:hypothetical protein